MKSKVNGQWEVEGCGCFGAGGRGSGLLDILRDNELGEEDEQRPVDRGYHHCELDDSQEGENTRRTRRTGMAVTKRYRRNGRKTAGHIQLTAHAMLSWQTHNSGRGRTPRGHLSAWSPLRSIICRRRVSWVRFRPSGANVTHPCIVRYCEWPPY